MANDRDKTVDQEQENDGPFSLWDTISYPDDLDEFFKSNQETIVAYYGEERERDENPPPRLPGSQSPEPNPHAQRFETVLQELETILAHKRVRAFHYTRLTEAEVVAIRQQGFGIASTELLTARLKKLGDNGDLTAAEVSTILEKSPYCGAEGQSRLGQFCMTAQPIPIEDERVFRLVRAWGGESVYWGLSDGSGLLKKLRQIGKPRICELSVALSECEGGLGLSARFAMERFARSIGCYDTREPIDLVVSSNLPADRIRHIHSEGETDFETLSKQDPFS